MAITFGRGAALDETIFDRIRERTRFRNSKLDVAQSYLILVDSLVRSERYDEAFEPFRKSKELIGNSLPEKDMIGGVVPKGRYFMHWLETTEIYNILAIRFNKDFSRMGIVMDYIEFPEVKKENFEIEDWGDQYSYFNDGILRDVREPRN